MDGLSLRITDLGTPRQAPALCGPSAASQAASLFHLGSPSDTALPPIGVTTSEGIAWADTPVYPISHHLHICFFKKVPFSEELHTDTNPLQVTVYIAFDPSKPELLHGIVCANNPLVYVDPSGNSFFGVEFLVGAIIGALIAGIQSDWNPKAMGIGAFIGGVSGGTFAVTESAVTSALTNVIGAAQGVCYYEAPLLAQFGGAVAGATAVGTVAGGMDAAFNGGNIGEGMLTGAMYGAASGVVMGGIGALYGYATGPTVASYGDMDLVESLQTNIGEGSTRQIGSDTFSESVSVDQSFETPGPMTASLVKMPPGTPQPSITDLAPSPLAIGTPVKAGGKAITKIVGSRWFKTHIFSVNKTQQGGTVLTFFGKLKFVGYRISSSGEKLGYNYSIKWGDEIHLFDWKK